MKRTASTLFRVLIILSVALAGCIGAPAAPQAEPVTAAVKDLTIAIEANGTIRAAQTAFLLWASSGEVDRMLVRLGDAVAQDQLLADLRVESLPQGLILASANINAAEQSKDALHDQYSEAALAQAHIALAAAGEALAKAKDAYRNTAHVASEDELNVALAKVTLVEKRLNDTITDNANLVNRFKLFGLVVTDVIRASLKSSEAAALAAYEQALEDYEDLLAGPDVEDVAIAAANVQLAEAQLADAELQVSLILAGPPVGDLAAADARIAAAQTQAETRRVTAPFAGTITQAAWLSGDRVNPGQVAFRLDDLSALYVDVYIAETDVNRVAIGQQVELETDSNPGATYTGEIVSLAPVGEAQGGAITFKAEVRVLDADAALRPGMSADIRIVIEVIENALTVPSAAVRLLNDARVVYILDEDGRQQAVAVELGRTVNGDVHVTGGELKAGDVVVLRPDI
jgi:multidrug efflux pump subunit AcrA (membrane-fusion protein)